MGKKLTIAIIGAGSIGQILAGKLSSQNNDVYLVAREKQSENLRKNGVRIRKEKASEEVYTLNILEELDQTKFYDAVCLAIRFEQLQDTLQQLKESKLRGQNLILCMPILCPDPKYYLSNFSETCVFFPGFAAKANSDGVIEYFFARRPSELGLIKGKVSEQIDFLTKILINAGIKTISKPDLGFRYTTLTAFGGPFGVAVSKCGFDLVACSKNKDLLRIAKNASVESLKVVRQITGKRSALFGILAYILPVYLKNFAPFLSKVKEVNFVLSHRRKVAKQDLLLLHEIYIIGEQRKIDVTSLRKLISFSEESPLPHLQTK